MTLPAGVLVQSTWTPVGAQSKTFETSWFQAHTKKPLVGIVANHLGCRPMKERFQPLEAYCQPLLPQACKKSTGPQNEVPDVEELPQKDAQEKVKNEEMPPTPRRTA